MVSLSIKNVIAFGLGAWGGYTFGDMGLLVGKFTWATEDRIMVIFGIFGAVMFLAPGYAKKKGGLKGVPSAIFLALGAYFLGAAVLMYRSPNKPV